MSSEFYAETGNPTSGATGSSATIRAEFAAISAGFSKLPTMAGHGDEILSVNSAGTAITSTNAAALFASVGVATTTDLALKADKASPVFTGTPQAPTATPGDSSLIIANTAFVADACAAVVSGAGGAPLNSPAFTGVPTAPTAAPGTNTTQLATTAHVKAAGDLKANLAGAVEFTGAVTYSGSITVPTQTAGNNTTLAASTAFVSTAVAAKASLASPTFTGVPAAPTATAGTNTTQLATTAFCTGALSAKANLTSPNFSGVPLADTAAAGTSTRQIASTGFVSAAIATIFGSASLAASGYVKFGTLFGGWMLAWGTGLTDSTALATITFPITFTAIYNIQFQNAMTTSAGSEAVYTTAASFTGMTVKTTAQHVSFYYLIIGKG